MFFIFVPCVLSSVAIVFESSVSSEMVPALKVNSLQKGVSHEVGCAVAGGQFFSSVPSQVVLVYCCCGLKEVVTDQLSDFFGRFSYVLVPFMAMVL